MKPEPGVPLEVSIKELVSAPNLRAVHQDAALAELAGSIKEHGVLEPVLVELHPEIHNGTGKTEGQIWLVAGQRRVAAAKLAGLRTVPAIVVPTTNDDRAQVQLVENLQREDLSPLEEAKAFRQQLEAGLTQKELATKIGKSQPYVANRIRLLRLPERGVKLLEAGKISPAIAEQVLKLPEDAGTEIGRIFALIESQLSFKAPTTELIEYRVGSALTAYRDRKRREATIAKAKFPKCPAPLTGGLGSTCGKKGRPEIGWAPSKWFTASCRHRWDPATGKLAPKETARGSEPARPAPPTLPEVDPNVPTALDQGRIARRILDAIKLVRSVDLDWIERRSGVQARITLVVEVPAIRGSQVPAFQFEEGHKFLELGDGAAYYQGSDRIRKGLAEGRAHLEAWLATFGTPGRKPANSAPNTEGDA